jgi:hypothetical protein
MQQPSLLIIAKHFLFFALLWKIILPGATPEALWRHQDIVDVSGKQIN